MSKKFILVLTAFIAGILLTTNVLAKPATGRVVVQMFDNYFMPRSITINRGQTVTWVNRGRHKHDVSINRSVNSGYIIPGRSFSFVFTQPGVYPYVCTLHTFLFWGMKGQVVVR